jgi:hypothetical protein
MAMRPFVCVAACIFVVLQSNVASSQSATIEVEQSGGYSTERVGAVSTKLGAFGEITPGLRFHISTVASKQSEESDAFGAAYPYTEHPVLLDAYAERTFEPRGGLLGLRAGRFRTPFGISSESDQGYVGFQRAPLIRYDDFFALSNTFFEHGVDVILGKPRLSLEASLGAPADVGEHTRPAGFDNIMRGQAAAGPFIIGISYIATRPHLGPADGDVGSELEPDDWHDEQAEHEVAPGRAVFGGLDLRWMRAGVQVRGELISGRPFDGARTHGGYLDLIVHRSFMGPVTAALRAERLRHYEHSTLVLTGERYTVATRIRLPRGFATHIEIVHNSPSLPSRRPTAVDIGLSYSLRFE